MLKLLKYVFIFIVLTATAETLLHQYTASKVDEKIMQSVKNGNAELPRMINDNIRAEKIEYSNHVVRFYASVIGTREIFDDEKSKFEGFIREKYCTGNMNLYAKANVAVAYSISYTSAGYGNTGWEFKITPDSCRSI